ncbi:MAG: SDR family oxidoreductase [Acidobacteria bacterium]|nr:SDR family oxidoreductase [Acidobacteriota bacterium]
MSLKTKPLSEQVAVVTGGGTGIGRAFAGALAAAGARVCIASRNETALRGAAEALNEGVGAERVFAYAFDVRVREECEALVRHCVGRFGSLDVLVNNSGLAVPETVDEITDEGWETVLQTNLKGAMWLVRAALPEMAAREFGDIVNVSSQAGKHGYADVPSYCASKWGLLGFAESVRDHARKTGANVRVFSLCPGLVDVENTAAGAAPRAGFVHVSNMAKTLLYALSLDREVVLEDINIYAR